MIKYIEVEEKKYPLVLNFSALMETEEATGKGLKDFQDFRLKDYLTLFHQMLIAGAEEKGEKYTSDIAHSKKLLNKCYGDFIALVPAFFDGLLQTKEERKIEAS